MKNDAVKIATLEANMTNIAKDIIEIKADIREIKNSLTPVSDLVLRVTRVEKSSNFWKWFSPSLAAVLGSTLTFLIINFLQNLK